MPAYFATAASFQHETKKPICVRYHSTIYFHVAPKAKPLALYLKFPQTLAEIIEKLNNVLLVIPTKARLHQLSVLRQM